jgi:hypothetical protein
MPLDGYPWSERYGAGISAGGQPASISRKVRRRSANVLPVPGPARARSIRDLLPANRSAGA